MTYNDFIAQFTWALRERGIKINQKQTKIMFEELANFVFEKVSEDEKINLREFLIFEKVKIPPHRLPTGEISDELYSIKVRTSEKFKTEFKESNNK